jgi:hypothetical protein
MNLLQLNATVARDLAIRVVGLLKTANAGSNHGTSAVLIVVVGSWVLTGVS